MVTARTVLALMFACQALWLTLIWWSGTAPHPAKLGPLLLYSGVVTLAIARLPQSFLERLERRGRALTMSDSRLWGWGAVLFLSCGGLYAYGFHGWPDEPHVVAAAKIVAEQGVGTFFQNYSTIPWLGPQHPPLVILVYGLVLRFCAGEIFALRLLSLLFGFATLGLTYRVGKELSTRATGLAAACWFFCMPFFFRLSPSVLIDMPITYCFMLAIFLMLRLLKEPSLSLAAFLGVSIGVGLLCKYTMIFVYPIVFLAWGGSGRVRQLLPAVAVIVVTSFVVFLPWLGYAMHEGIFASQGTRLTYYAGYVTSSANGTRWLLSVLAFRLPSGIGMAYLPLFGLGLWEMFHRRHWNDYFLGGWMLAVALPLLLTLPGPRYFFPAFPAVAIVMAYGLRALAEDRGRVLLLALLFAASSLYLFIDWHNAVGGVFTR